MWFYFVTIPRRFLFSFFCIFACIHSVWTYISRWWCAYIFLVCSILFSTKRILHFPFCFLLKRNKKTRNFLCNSIFHISFFFIYRNYNWMVKWNLHIRYALTQCAIVLLFFSLLYFRWHKNHSNKKYANYLFNFENYLCVLRIFSFGFYNLYRLKSGRITHIQLYFTFGTDTREKKRNETEVKLGNPIKLSIFINKDVLIRVLLEFQCFLLFYAPF